MTVLFRKEIRSLLPAWVMTMAATALIAFVRPNGAPALLFVVGIGCVLLGITSFGVEFSHGTFSLLLAQPIPRSKIWWTKTITLGAAMLSVAIMVSVVLFCKFHLSSVHIKAQDVAMPVIFALLLFGAAFAGGLLFALTYRQVAMAFWIALLPPFLAWGFADTFTEGRLGKIINISIAAALAVYDLLAFFLARHQFLQAQDLPGRTGPTISFPTWMRFGTKARSATATPSRRPWRALIAKELRLHEVSLCVAAFLLAMHLIAVFIRRMILHPGNSQSMLYESLAAWSLMWFFLPVIIAGSAVAEERRQGTLEGSFCLPARRSTQWFIKCAVCFFLSVLFAGVMPWLLESAAQLIGCPWIFQNRSSFADPWYFLRWSVTLAAIMSLVGFYASSLARNLLQAVGIAVIAGSVFIWFALQAAAHPGGVPLLSGLVRFGLPASFLLLLWLSYTNFKHLTVGWRLWLENAAVLLLVVIAVPLFLVFLVCWSGGLFSRLFYILTQSVI